MAPLTWNEALALQQPRMDRTHREFVDLLNAVASALDGEALPLALSMQDAGFDLKTGALRLHPLPAETGAQAGCDSDRCA